MTHLLVKVRAEREKDGEELGGTKDGGAEPIQGFASLPRCCAG